MMKRKLMMGIATLAIGVGSPVRAETSAAITVRDACDGRVWQVRTDAPAPLTWTWPKLATSANVMIDCIVEKRILGPYAVARAEGGTYGTLALALPDSAVDRERMYAVTVEFMRGTSAYATNTTSFVMLPATFEARNDSSLAWKVVFGPSVFAYDAAWLPETAAAETAAVSYSPSAVQDLEGTSGWAALVPRQLFGKTYGPFTASLDFDTAEAAWTASLAYSGLGTLMIFR